MLTSEQKQRIDKLFDLWVENRGAGGQLVVVHKGETVYEQCCCTTLSVRNDTASDINVQDANFVITRHC